jgi:signal transduction histidine kinase
MAFPIILGTTIIMIIVKTMYYGGRRESLAAQAESAMIRWALAYATKPVTDPDKVINISVSDDDLDLVKRSPDERLTDAHISEYATILEQVAPSNPDWIVISWLTYAHPMTPEYLRPLTETIDRLNIHNKVTIAINLYASGTISPEFMTRYNIVEARDCYYDINSFCTVSTEWTWMPQQVMNRFFKNRPRWVVSTTLPHIYPNVLLNVPAPSTLRNHSFLDLKAPSNINLKPGAIIFIGNNSSQHLSFRNNKDALQKTYVAASEKRRSLVKDGIPWHTFWSSMAAMFIEERTVAVAPVWVKTAMLTILTLAILVAIIMLGGLALAPFLIIALLMPAFNMLGVRYFGIYIPVMDMIIAGVVTFTGATFISIALSSYRKLRFVAEEDVAIDTANIKENFIHLISHNLNTPIAQLRGLIDILGPLTEGNDSLTQASRKLEYVRLITQSVLNASSLTANAPLTNEVSIRDFMGRFLEFETGFFQRTGISISVSPAFDDEETGDIWFFRFTIDQGFVTNLIVNTSILCALVHQSADIRINVASVSGEPGAPQGLVIQITAQTSNTYSPPASVDFCLIALNRYLNTAAGKGLVDIQKLPQGFSLKIAEPTE